MQLLHTTREGWRLPCQFSPCTFVLNFCLANSSMDQHMHTHPSLPWPCPPVVAGDNLGLAVQAFLTTLQNSCDYVNVFCCLDSPLDRCKWDLQQLKLLLV